MSTQAPSTSSTSLPTIAMFSYLAVLAVALVPALAAPLDGFVARQTPAGTTLHPNGDLTRCLSAATSVVAGEPGARITMCVYFSSLYVCPALTVLSPSAMHATALVPRLGS